LKSAKKLAFCAKLPLFSDPTASYYEMKPNCMKHTCRK